MRKANVPNVPIVSGAIVPIVPFVPGAVDPVLPPAFLEDDDGEGSEWGWSDWDAPGQRDWRGFCIS